MNDGRQLARQIRSFRYAFRGILVMLQSEVNARVHALATLVVIAAGFAFDIDRFEWMLLALTISAVWSLEAVNTAVEAVCDVLSPDLDARIERAKDVAAAAVLISAIAALVIAALIFGRRLLALAAS